MKAKTIKSAIRAKINKWLDSITDEGVRKLASENTIVTGGCIVSFLTQQKINDYDVYFRTKEAARAVAEYYVARFKNNPPPKFKDSGREVEIWVEDKDDHLRVVVKSQGIASENGSDDYQYFEAQPDEQGEEFIANVTANVTEADEVPIGATEDPKGQGAYRPIFLSGNAITLSGHVQLVLRFIGEPEQIHTYYDFIHCTCYWKSWDGELVLPQAALEAIITKELRYVGSKYPLCSIIRIRKFTARGWTINAGQILKMVMQLQDLDLRDVNVLQDQLTGVDAAYFMQVIDRLKKKQEQEGTVGQPIDSTYLVSLIDKLF